MLSATSYDKFPKVKTTGELFSGWQSICARLKREIKGDRHIIAVDTYTGIHEQEVMAALRDLEPALFIHTPDLFLSEQSLRRMTERFITEDVLFGYLSNLRLKEYFDPVSVSKAVNRIMDTSGTILIFGPGASLIVPEADTLVYLDMPRWEIQQRFRSRSVKALGIDNRGDAVSCQYKRGYFNDWRVCDNHKKRIYGKVDFWIDTTIPGQPKMIDAATFSKGIRNAVAGPFRVVPFFDPAPWGGHWMRTRLGLEENGSNYGWCFDCVPEENSLLLEVGDVVFEMPAMNLVYLKTRQLLGEAVEARFGQSFPIRFDFLDTMDGGNLSLQVHPTQQFAAENFGLPYTQDESYYLMDAGPDGIVYLGLKEGADKDAMARELRLAESGKIEFDADKYVNTFPAKKHDHFLIPAGTIHCSGSNSLVLEISSTPNIFTFKLWDWGRLGLDGKPRPINVERGLKVIDWSRDTRYVERNLVNAVTTVAEGDGWKEEKTGLHPNEFIETRRHWFSGMVPHNTGGSVNVLNLVEGKEAVVESPSGKFETFVVHYAETFIIPAHIGDYTIRPYGASEGEVCATMKAYVKI